MNKSGQKIAVGIVVVIVLLVGVALFIMRDAEVPVNDNDLDTVDVELDVYGGEYYFEPEELSVEPGSEVRINFINEGNMNHDLVIDDIGQTDVIGSGEEDSFDFIVPEDQETLTFYCSIPGHRDNGMEGVIEIG